MSSIHIVTKKLLPLPYIDAAIEQLRDELGEPVLRDRAEMLNTALKEYTKDHDVRLTHHLMNLVKDAWEGSRTGGAGHEAHGRI
ncbi:MAG: hypothetical protein QXH67_06390 [Candidatus Bathyarchaeia archaeon]